MNWILQSFKSVARTAYNSQPVHYGTADDLVFGFDTCQFERRPAVRQRLQYGHAHCVLQMNPPAPSRYVKKSGRWRGSLMFKKFLNVCVVMNFSEATEFITIK